MKNKFKAGIVLLFVFIFFSNTFPASGKFDLNQYNLLMKDLRNYDRPGYKAYTNNKINEIYLYQFQSVSILDKDCYFQVKNLNTSEIFYTRNGYINNTENLTIEDNYLLMPKTNANTPDDFIDYIIQTNGFLVVDRYDYDRIYSFIPVYRKTGQTLKVENDIYYQFKSVEIVNQCALKNNYLEFSNVNVLGVLKEMLSILRKKNILYYLSEKDQKEKIDLVEGLLTIYNMTFEEKLLELQSIKEEGINDTFEDYLKLDSCLHSLEINLK